MNRVLDISFSFVGLLLLSPLLVLLLIIGFFDTGSPIFVQERVGRGKRPFRLIKFRSMYLNAPSVATHLASANSITPYGSYLRKSKLDELPQLWNVFIGDMSLVGPRPNLFNQTELMDERQKFGIYDVRPGITGLSQVNQIDMSNPRLLAETDAKMIKELNVFSYIKYIFFTLFGMGLGDKITK